ncbi:polyadenylate-binding protein, cytoplasmic and nuclear-like [Arachis duranensis]|uniref:Polyadenylate-binding protein, cytoplasmic and nuclear-like n=1 Tax=Arachis duranensis TaxID=130453 RepID=A0A9C6U0D3_ARADU|nr:polyadenylate-binding protein, cytoplasmic and nuclear-like [Arachis duranensis]
MTLGRVMTPMNVEKFEDKYNSKYVGLTQCWGNEIHLFNKVFEAFGQVELVQLHLDESENCKGFGFVQFARLENARNAQSLNGQLEIGGRTIKFELMLVLENVHSNTQLLECKKLEEILVILMMMKVVAWKSSVQCSLKHKLLPTSAAA